MYFLKFQPKSFLQIPLISKNYTQIPGFFQPCECWNSGELYLFERKMGVLLVAIPLLLIDVSGSCSLTIDSNVFITYWRAYWYVGVEGVGVVEESDFVLKS